MQLTSLMRGAHFGNLYKLHGIVTYKLSAFEQKAFPQFFKHTMPNTFRRIRSNIFIVTPPFIIGYIVYDCCERLHAKYHRKDPNDYKDDE